MTIASLIDISSDTTQNGYRGVLIVLNAGKWLFATHEICGAPGTSAVTRDVFGKRLFFGAQVFGVKADLHVQHRPAKSWIHN